MTPIPHRLFVSNLVPALLATALLVPVAGAQTPAGGVYAPPTPYLVIPPPGGPNPYLIYVPAPQPAPMQIVPPPQAAPAPAPAAAQGPSLADLGKRLSSYFTPEEQNLLVDYMKESVMAAFKGEEVFLPPDLAFKLEILLVRMQKEGGMYMDNLIKQLERDLKRSLKESLTPPGAKPAEAPAPPKTEPALAPTPPAAPPAGNSKLPVKKAGRKNA